MNRFEPNLRIPGPTALPPSVRAAGARQMINHRGPEFAAMLERILTRMKPYFGTTSDVAILSCAGTGGLEAAVVNVLSPGRPGPRRVDRLVRRPVRQDRDDLRRRHDQAGRRVGRGRRPGRGAGSTGRGAGAGLQGRPAHPQRDLDRGDEPDPGHRCRDPRGRRQRAHPGRQRVGPRAPSRSRWMPGASTSSSPARRRPGWPPRAWRWSRPRTGPGRRWRRRRCRASTSTCTPTATHTPRARPRGHRPSRSSTRSTRASSSWSARARPAVFARHEACAAATRAGLRALGFELFADQRFASPTVTAARLPEGLDWKAFNDGVKRRGVILAGGQGKIAGHVFRIGHLGSVTLAEILDAIGVIEEVSLEHDRPVEAGAAVAAAQRAALEAMGPWPRSRREDPRRRADRPGGHRAPPGAPRGRRAGRARTRGIRDDPAGLRRARRPEPGPGRRRAHRRRHAARRHRSGRGRRRQRRPRGGDPGRDRGRQRPDRQHDRRGRAHARPALRGRPAGRGGRCLAPARRVEAQPVHRGRAARPDPRDRRPGQDRPGDRRPGAGDGDDRPRPSIRSCPRSRPRSTASSSSSCRSSWSGPTRSPSTSR